MGGFTLKHNRFASIACLVSLIACTSFAAVEDRQNLGFGFHHDLIAEPTANPSESIGHFHYLFYRTRKLSQSDRFAVAPSGASIVYQDGPSGNIFLFRRRQGNVAQLTSTFPGLVERFEGHEHEGYIVALLIDAKGHKRSMRLMLGPQH